MKVELTGLCEAEPDIQYPYDTKCACCGFKFGDHHNSGAWCPSGPRDRVLGFLRYSDEHYFTPILPRLPTLFNHAMFAFTDQTAVVNYLAQSKNDRPSLLRKHERVAMKYKFSLFLLIRTLVNENRDLKKQLKEAQAYNDTTRSNY